MEMQLVKHSSHEASSVRSDMGVYPKLMPWRRIGIGLVLVLLISVIAGGVGSVYIPPVTLVRIVISQMPLVDVVTTWPDTWSTIIWQIRLPRVVLAGLVGSALAISGAAYQALFRNPLADPYLVGVSSGAGLGATIVLLTGLPLLFHGLNVLPLAAFAGGLLAVTLAYTAARRKGVLPLTTLILAGVAIAALFTAVTSLLMIRSDPDLRPLLSWLLGGFISAGWRDVLTVLPYLIFGSLIMICYGRTLNLFQLSPDEIKQLGVNVESTKLFLIAIASLTTAAAVSVCGLIGFVGLIAPHVVRLLWGYDNRLLLPMAMIVGAGFLILADMVSRIVVSPSELPVGIVTAFCGGPFFLFLLRKVRGVTV